MFRNWSFIILFFLVFCPVMLLAQNVTRQRIEANFPFTNAEWNISSRIIP